MAVKLCGLWTNGEHGVESLQLIRGITCQVFFDRGSFAYRVMGEVQGRCSDSLTAKRRCENILRQMFSEALDKLRVQPLEMPHL